MLQIIDVLCIHSYEFLFVLKEFEEGVGWTEVGCGGEDLFCEGVEYMGILTEDFDVEHVLTRISNEFQERGFGREVRRLRY